MIPHPQKLQSTFKKRVWKYYKTHKRSLPWRETHNPYHILVSEVMLQQTQVERVRNFYNAFLKKFPTAKALAQAPLSAVLVLWKGLGYNRRAVNLKKAAETVMREFKGVFPADYTSLIALPGIGQSTAGAIMNFSYNIPTAFIETNIRSVYLHHFFKDKKDVSDKDVMKLIEETQDTKNPREWYYALYDYGTFLKKTIGNQNSRSRHYKKQSAFKGSNRELRSLMLSYLLAKKKSVSTSILFKYFTLLGKEKGAVQKNVDAFLKEGVITRKGNTLSIID
jgi:A/G-specific adenine glycosylase